METGELKITRKYRSYIKSRYSIRSKNEKIKVAVIYDKNEKTVSLRSHLTINKVKGRVAKIESGGGYGRRFESEKLENERNKRIEFASVVKELKKLGGR
jgi:hypothetical protein